MVALSYDDVPHWMANNLFIYYPMLLVSVFICVYQSVCLFLEWQFYMGNYKF